MQAKKPPPQMPPLHSQMQQNSPVQNTGTSQPASAEKPSLLSSTLPNIVMLSALAGLCVLGWYAYEEATVPRDLTDLPVIKAEAGPYKIKPSDPGGMQIPNLDKTIYDTISGKEPVEENQLVKIKPISSSEEPLDREKIKEISARQNVEPAAPASSDNTAKKVPLPVPEYYTLQEPEKTVGSFNKAPIPISRPAEVKKPKSMPTELTEIEDIKTEPVARTIPPPASMPDATAKTGSGFSSDSASFLSGAKIQLGAFRSTEEVKSTWIRLTGKYPELLGNLAYGIQKADLKEKGIFYRLHAGPLNSRDDANILCKKLIARGQGCFVVK